MGKGTIIAVILLTGIAVFHVAHHALYCRHRTDPARSHCRDCGHRRICQKYHHKR